MKLVILLVSTIGIGFGPSSGQNIQAHPFLTVTSTRFGPFIEGASVNRAGHMFATNYGNANTLNQLGQFFPGQQFVFADPQANTYYNGIRFFNDREAFATDMVNHRVVRLTLETIANTTTVTGSSTFCQNSNMLQPNDLAISRSGIIFLSGMNWSDNTVDTDGDIWSCTPQGTALLLDRLGRTNGIELSADERHLYVSESYNRDGTPYIQRIWVYDVNNQFISNKQLFADFANIDNSVSVDIDGMRTDMSNNLYVTRNGGRAVTIFNQSGTVIGTIGLNFARPTNLEFGGPYGTTLFIVGSCEQDWPGILGCVDQIQMTAPGRAWSNLQG
ncbi:hypothetical protein HA402_005748 [Bradysia odoriphaga]|nr:hypothetical protein HA402_005748 [Bradysia odoriphaga]